ncbi:KED [Plasmodium yoelii yoelii]|uniref:KED n=1 Tax=Plasmodium yoelii yoelii TaxID=73239 RepID=Q7RRW2_PLAYO|nr:KED [Plasmodium yoelii yoelii]
MEKDIICENHQKDENCDKIKDSNIGGDIISQEKKTDDLKSAKKSKKNKNKKKNKRKNTKKNKSKNKSKNKNKNENEKNENVGTGEEINSIVNFLKKNEPEYVQKEDNKKNIEEVEKKEENISLEISPQKKEKEKGKGKGKEKTKAKKNNNTDIDEQNDRTVFVGNIPLNDVSNLKLLKILGINKSLVESGVAFILFKNRASVKKAINMFNGKEIKDRVITVEKLLNEKENDKNYKSKNDFKKNEPKKIKQKNKNRFKHRPNNGNVKIGNKVKRKRQNWK